MSRKAYPKAALNCYHNLLRQSMVPNRTCGRRSGTFLDPGHPCCSACGSLVAVFIFFLEDEHWLTLQGEPRLLQGYDVAEFHRKATHLRGTI